MEILNKKDDKSLNLEKSIKIILSQTNYNEEEALLKLKEFDYNEINVIKDYLGIKIDEKQLKSINQEIYKQIRLSLDNSMAQYREKNPINIEKVLENFKEEENKKQKIN